jgi:enoyl-CoA hydratase/carnithine racemase
VETTVAEISLARTERLRDWLFESLEQALESAHVILLDGTSGMAEETGLEALELARLVLFELPVVFVFEGPLRGSQTELALAADIRVCSTAASMQGRLSGNSRVRTLANDADALALFLGREILSADALLNAGLVSRVAPAGQALEEARALAETIAIRGPIATRLAKEAIWRGLGQPLDQALRFETDLTLLLQTTKDRAEGVRAFLEKRPPIFTGE